VTKARRCFCSGGRPRHVCLVIAAVAVAVTNAGTVSTTDHARRDRRHVHSQAPRRDYGGATSMTRVAKKRSTRLTCASPSASCHQRHRDRCAHRGDALNSSGVRPTLKKQITGSWSESTLTYANAPGIGLQHTSPPAIKAGPVTFPGAKRRAGNGTFSFGLIQERQRNETGHKGERDTAATDRDVSQPSPRHPSRRPSLPRRHPSRSALRTADTPACGRTTTSSGS